MINVGLRWIISQNRKDKYMKSMTKNDQNSDPKSPPGRIGFMSSCNISPKIVDKNGNNRKMHLQLGGVAWRLRSLRFPKRALASLALRTWTLNLARWNSSYHFLTRLSRKACFPFSSVTCLSNLSMRSLSRTFSSFKCLSKISYS